MIATIGEALVDMIERPDGSFEACLGGSVCNFTLGLARQGAAVTYLNPLSTDRFGSKFAALLAAAGAHAGAPQASPCPTSLAVVSLDEHGVPTYAFYRDNVADRDVSAAQLISSLPAQPQLLHTGGLALVPEDCGKMLDVIEAASLRGALISLDANLRPVAVSDHAAYIDGVRQALRRAHIVKVSDEDLAVLGLDRLSQDELAATLFDDAHTELIALTLGARGAVLLTRSCQVALPAPVDLALVDTVGAGDCFHAGLIACLQRTGQLSSPAALQALPPEALEMALLHALASASINIMQAGCKPPTWDQVQAFVTKAPSSHYKCNIL